MAGTADISSSKNFLLYESHLTLEAPGGQRLCNLPKVTPQINGRDETTQPGVTTPSQQSVLLQKCSLLSGNGPLSWLCPHPSKGGKEFSGSGTLNYLNFQATNGLLEFIHMDHLFTFHLFSAAWTGLFSRRHD